MNIRRLITATAAAAATGALVLTAPLAASAHVTVDPGRAEPGSYVTLTFKVPTESATAGTVKLEVDLPTNTPFGYVAYQPIAGWKTEVVDEKLATPITTDDGTVTEAPTKIVWTADPGTEVAPGQFQQFTISAGAVPNTGKILLPAHQTYSDGTVVDWTEPTPATGKEPEHPAPTLYVKDAPPANHGGMTVTSTPAAAVGGPVGEPVLGTVLGLAGLALGAIALVLAVYAVTRGARDAKARR